MPEIAFYATVDAHLLTPAAAAAEAGVVLHCASRGQLERSENRRMWLRHAAAADLLILRVFGGTAGLPGVERLLAELEREGGRVPPILVKLPVGERDDQLMRLSTVKAPLADLIRSYLEYGGFENMLNMFRYLAGWAAGTAGEVPPPAPLPATALYRPGRHDVVYSAQKYRDAYFVPERSWTAGVLFHQSHWVNGNLEYVDALVAELETQGANVLPLFLRSDVDTRAAFRDMLFLEGRPAIDVLLNVMVAPAILDHGAEHGHEGKVDGVFEELDVPVLQGIASYQAAEEWRDSPLGLNSSDIVYNVALPEFSGHLITLPIAVKDVEVDDGSGRRLGRHRVLPERLTRYVQLARNWARLRQVPNDEKRVAILFHNYPPRNDTIGTAQGLDSPASVVNVMAELVRHGYRVDRLPKSGAELMAELLETATRDTRMLGGSELLARAVAAVPADTYAAWFSRLTERMQGQIAGHWGPPPGEILVHDGQQVVPGTINGNLFIGIQPGRGFAEDPEAAYHSPDLVFPHSYHGYYTWLRDEFKADVVVHVGTHGSLEWLPGKSVGLSADCYPDAAIATLPNVYPYVINNPGEGTQAKRRSYACVVDHLNPVLQAAGSYGELERLDDLLGELRDAVSLAQTGKVSELRNAIWEQVREAHLDADLEQETEPTDFDAFAARLHSYLGQVRDAHIKDGLHILGEAAEGERLVNFLEALTRLPNGQVPSLRQALAQGWALDLDALLADGASLHEFDGRRETGAELVDLLREVALELLAGIAGSGFDSAAVPETIRRVLAPYPANDATTDLATTLAYVCDRLVPNLRRVDEEITSVRRALEGRYISPGLSGSPSRGMAHILPTGRNFFSLDPRTVPTPAAWEVGRRLADSLIERFVSEQGVYPASVGITVWGSPMIRTRGDDIAEVLWLLGVRPVWHAESGHAKGLEVIPLAELGRPRIDVTMRISGFMRDAFPAIVDMLDDAVRLVAFLDEADEDNYVAASTRREIGRLLAEGSTVERAREAAAWRVFGCMPMSYGTGVSQVMEGQNWRTAEDLANVYVTWGGYVYGRGKVGRAEPELFRRRLADVRVTVKNMDDREHDVLGSSDYYAFHGGMTAAVATFSGAAPMDIVGDSSDPARVHSRTVAEENRRLFRTRVLNPKWIEGMKRHGYKAAGDISKLFDYVLGWDATAGAVDDWMYERLASTFVLDEEFAEWTKEVNPWARQNMLERLLEAAQRGLWDADPELLDELRRLYADAEGDVEARLVPA